jgi:hypothetical protein
LLGKLLVSYLYQAAYDWSMSMIKKGGLEFANFSSRWEAKGPAALTYNKAINVINK